MDGRGNMMQSNDERGAEKSMDDYLKSAGLHRKRIAKDGSCLFRAVAEQVLHCQSHHTKVRAKCVEFLKKNRDSYEAVSLCVRFIEGDFDAYLCKIQDPQHWVGEVEINALAVIYKRDFLIYQEPGKPAVNITAKGFKDKVQLCFLNGNHYDSVYPISHMKNAAVCQSLLYELLYDSVFKMDCSTLTVLQRASRPSDLLSDDSMPACPSSDESDPETDQPLWTEDGAPTGPRHNGQPHRGRGRGGRLMSERMRRSLNPTLFRNVEYDVWMKTKRAQQKMDFCIAAGMQYTTGDRCQVCLDGGGRSYSATIKEVSPSNGPVTVYIEELARKVSVPLWNLRLPSEDSWRTVNRDKKLNGHTPEWGEGSRGRARGKPPLASAPPSSSSVSQATAVVSTGRVQKQHSWPPQATVEEQAGRRASRKSVSGVDQGSFGLTDEERLVKEEEQRNVALVEIQLRDEQSFPALGPVTQGDGGKRRGAERRGVHRPSNTKSPVEDLRAPFLSTGDRPKSSSPPLATAAPSPPPTSTTSTTPDTDSSPATAPTATSSPTPKPSTAPSPGSCASNPTWLSKLKAPLCNLSPASSPPPASTPTGLPIRASDVAPPPCAAPAAKTSASAQSYASAIGTPPAVPPFAALPSLRTLAPPLSSAASSSRSPASLAPSPPSSSPPPVAPPLSSSASPPLSSVSPPTFIAPIVPSPGGFRPPCSHSHPSLPRCSPPLSSSLLLPCAPVLEPPPGFVLNSSGSLGASACNIVQAPLPQTQAPLPQTQAPLPQTQAPLPQTQAPLPQTQAPLSQTQVPLSQAQVPLPQTQVPLSQAQVPLSQAQVPLSQAQVPLSQAQVPLPQTQVPLSQAQVPLSQTQAPLPHTQVPLPQTQVPLSQAQVPLSRTQVPLSQAQVPLSQTQVPLCQTQAPLPQTQAPLPQTQAPLPQTQVPLSQAQVPLSQAQVPLSQAQVPLSQTQAPLPQTQAPLPQTQAPLPQTQVPLSQAQVPLSQTQVPLSQTQVPLSQTQVPLSQTQVPLSQTPAPLSQAQVPLSQTQVPLSQAQVPLSQAQVPLSQTPAPLSQAQVPLSQAQAQVQSSHPAAGFTYPHSSQTSLAPLLQAQTQAQPTNLQPPHPPPQHPHHLHLQPPGPPQQQPVLGAVPLQKLSQLYQDPLYPGFPLGQDGHMATPAYSHSQAGDDLPRDINILRWFFNLGVKAYSNPLFPPYVYLLPLQQAHQMHPKLPSRTSSPCPSPSNLPATPPPQAPPTQPHPGVPCPSPSWQQHQAPPRNPSYPVGYPAPISPYPPSHTPVSAPQYPQTQPLPQGYPTPPAPAPSPGHQLYHANLAHYPPSSLGYLPLSTSVEFQGNQGTNGQQQPVDGTPSPGRGPGRVLGRLEASGAANVANAKALMEEEETLIRPVLLLDPPLNNTPIITYVQTSKFKDGPVAMTTIPPPGDASISSACRHGNNHLARVYQGQPANPSQVPNLAPPLSVGCSTEDDWGAEGFEPNTSNQRGARRYSPPRTRYRGRGGERGSRGRGRGGSDRGRGGYRKRGAEEGAGFNYRARGCDRGY
ncbi:OTU domain-containing protein 4 [Polymixia lowei]